MPVYFPLKEREGGRKPTGLALRLGKFFWLHHPGRDSQVGSWSFGVSPKLTLARVEICSMQFMSNVFEHVKNQRGIPDHKATFTHAVSLHNAHQG